MAAKDVLGRRGEDLAVEYLQHRGLLDVVATDSERLVVCEVKTRSTAWFGEPAEAVNGKKAARIRRVTQAWLSTHSVNWVEVRFDVVSVVAEPGRPATVQHYEAAF
jgi:putative endonuclease